MELHEEHMIQEKPSAPEVTESLIGAYMRPGRAYAEQMLRIELTDQTGSLRRCLTSSERVGRASGGA